jgi:hypothetical protein
VVLERAEELDEAAALRHRGVGSCSASAAGGPPTGRQFTTNFPVRVRERERERERCVVGAPGSVGNSGRAGGFADPIGGVGLGRGREWGGGTRRAPRAGRGGLAWLGRRLVPWRTSRTGRGAAVPCRPPRRPQATRDVTCRPWTDRSSRAGRRPPVGEEATSD